MVKKKSPINKNVPLPRVRAKLPSKKMILLVIVVFFLGLFAYNKYLDYRNVQDMKQLLADFEQLERDVETETGEELYIEASCGSGGIFASFYSCSLAIPKQNGTLTSYNGLDKKILDKYTSCETLTSGRNNFRNALNCTISVRDSNKNKSEEIFFEYDTTPGSAF